MHKRSMLFSMLAGLIIGIITTYYVLLGARSKYEIAYVSEEEIMQLERNRVEKEALKDAKTNQDLFFGQIDKAVELTSKLAQKHNSTSIRVVYSLGPVYGNRVRSISAEVHAQVLQNLMQQFNSK